MLSEVPDALQGVLPGGVGTSGEDISEALRERISVRSLLTLIGKEISGRWGEYGSLLAQLIGLLLLKAVWNAFCTQISSPTLCGGVQMLCRLGVLGVIMTHCLSLLEGVTAFFRDLSALGGAFLPLMGAMYAMGGNVGTAVANQSTLVLTFSLIEWVGGQSAAPVMSLCLAFTVMGVFDASVAPRMQLLSAKLKKWYTTALSLMMLVLSTSLSMQTLLASRADSLGFRTVRFAVSSGIPVVGGGVAEMMRTAAAGLGWLRGLVGLSGILLLLSLLLPCVLHLLMIRLVFSLAEDASVWLGCGEEGRLLGEVRSLYGYLLAVVSVCVMCFFFALLILIRCGAAYAA